MTASLARLNSPIPLDTLFALALALDLDLDLDLRTSSHLQRLASVCRTLARSCSRRFLPTSTHLPTSTAAPTPPGRSEVLGVNIADKEAPHYVCNDHTFLHLRFAYNEELGGDVLWIQTHKIDMDDDSVTAGLKAIRDILVECADRDVHFCSMYDLRTYKLPGVSGGYARAKQLIGWCQTLATPQKNLINDHIHSVAVRIARVPACRRIAVLLHAAQRAFPPTLELHVPTHLMDKTTINDIS